MAKPARARASSAAKTIRIQTIWSRLRQVLDPRGTTTIKPTDAVSKHIKGGAGAVAAFANVLNASHQFSADKLDLVPGDLRGASLIGHICTAIVWNYEKNGWTVIA